VVKLIVKRIHRAVAYIFSYILRKFDKWELKNTAINHSKLSPDRWGLASNSENHLVVQGIDSVRLAKQYGTPLFVIDKNRLRKNYFHFYSCFQENYSPVEIAYSYKTNPLPGVLKLLHEFGASAEVVSPFELWLALKLNVAPEKIIFNGPAKTEESLSLAISKNIKLINLDGPAEIEALKRLTKNHDRRQKVGVRLITSVGWQTKFGFHINTGEAFEAFKKLKANQNIDPCGLHIHLGTGIKNIEKYLQAIKEVIEFSQRLKKELDISISVFDLGGGFWVPTIRSYSKLDYQLFKKNLPAQLAKEPTCPSIMEYSSAITGLFDNYTTLKSDKRPMIILEPGRAITCSAQMLLLSVLQIKPSENDLTTVILDGGRSIARAIPVEYHEIFNASNMNDSRELNYSLFGPTCRPQDILCPVKRLPLLQTGDVTAIMDAGAYWIPSQSNFSFPRATAVMVENGRHELIRKKESFEHMVSLDFFT
jgi:diaminopimelate decarboxylase